MFLRKVLNGGITSSTGSNANLRGDCKLASVLLFNKQSEIQLTGFSNTLPFVILLCFQTPLRSVSFKDAFSEHVKIHQLFSAYESQQFVEVSSDGNVWLLHFWHGLTFIYLKYLGSDDVWIDEPKCFSKEYFARVLTQGVVANLWLK